MSAQAAESPLLRIGVAVAVPVLAVTAHGAASGMMPGSAGLMLCVALGALLGALVGGSKASWWRVAAVLSIGQLLGHPAASVGDVAGHSWHATPMLLWHLLAVPLSALLLVLVARFFALVTAVLRVLTSQPPVAVAGSPAALSGVWHPRTAVAGAGAAPRAPPFSR